MSRITLALVALTLPATKRGNAQWGQRQCQAAMADPATERLRGRMQVSNTGTAVLRVISISTSGDFVLSGQNCGSSVAAGGSCTISVSFTPMMSGMRTGALNFIDNANGVQGNIQIIPLSGTGQ